MLKFDAKQRKTIDKSKIARPLGKNRILTPYLESAIAKGTGNWTFDYQPKTGDDAWHPSGDCIPPASHLYSRAKEHLALQDHPGSAIKEKISASLQKSFMVGHFWHQWVQFLILQEGLADPSAIERVGEKTWDYRYDICSERCNLTTGGHSENCLAWRVLGPKPFNWVRGQGDVAPLKTPYWEGLVDIKTMSGTNFRQPALPTAFAIKYICQMNIYMDLFDLEQAMILAINKDAPHDFKEINFVRNQGLIDAIYLKWSFVSGCLDRDCEPDEDDDAQFALPTEIAEINNSY